MTDTLHDSPWIPIRRANGCMAKVGLVELFEQGHNIADLEGTPTERISILRLLVCLTQAAVGAPENSQKWGRFGVNLQEKVLAYLQTPEVREALQLFSGGRFLQNPQVATRKMVTGAVGANKKPAKVKDEVFVSYRKMVPYLATGNNASHFDHYSAVPRQFSLEDIALHLVTFQATSPTYGKGHKGMGLCATDNAAHTVLIGGNLAETILLNCLDAQTISGAFPGGMGRPIWERGPSDPLGVKSYLGRLVSRPRAIWLVDKVGFRIEGIDAKYPFFTGSEIREPSATRISVVREKKKKKNGEEKREPALLRLALGRSIWSDLPSILAGSAAKKQLSSPPLVVSSHQSALNAGQAQIWVGGQIANKGKVTCFVSSRLPLSKNFFAEPNYLVYIAGVDYAERGWRALDWAFSTYSTGMGIEKPSGAAKAAVSTAYWHLLDQSLGCLLDIVDDPETALRGNDFGPADGWGQTVHRAMRAAYDAACPSGTSRQSKAFVKGINCLRIKCPPIQA